MTPGWLLVLVGPPSWMTTVGAFHEEKKSSSACKLQAFLLKDKVVHLAAISERF